MGRQGIAAVLIACCVFGQPAHLSFDVAAVKASKARTGGFAPSRTTFEPGGQRFTATDASVKRLITIAYDISDAQVTGGPAWLTSDGFDIEAKAEHAVGPEQLRLMLRNLLAERFDLTLRQEQQELTVSALIVGKGVPRLQPAADPTTSPSISLRSRSARTMSVKGQNVTMPFIATWLSGRLQRTVVDRTNLAGSFDFTIETVFDQGEVNDPNVSEREIMVHLFGDMVQKIGLTLQSQKALVEVFTVERALKPSVN